ncbi:hypothetical protein AAY473_031573 [Plecturocebus cupreus]
MSQVTDACETQNPLSPAAHSTMLCAQRHNCSRSMLFIQGGEALRIATIGLELLSSSHSPSLASQNAEIIDMSHHTWPHRRCWAATGSVALLRLLFTRDS